MSKIVHSVGITKGDPDVSREVDPKTHRSKSRATWRANCSCGWSGTDHADAIQAQDDALSHQVGRHVNRTIMQRRSVHEQGTDRGFRRTTWDRVR